MIDERGTSAGGKGTGAGMVEDECKGATGGGAVGSDWAVKQSDRRMMRFNCISTLRLGHSSQWTHTCFADGKRLGRKVRLEEVDVGKTAQRAQPSDGARVHVETLKAQPVN